MSAASADGRLDLNEHLVAHRESTFLIRVRSDSMSCAGIRDGDLLVVDRALEAGDGDLVVAEAEGGLTLKRLYQAQRPRPPAAGEPLPAFLPRPADDAELSIWGVATSVVHRLR
jgi:DNA polymerase V